MCVSQLHTHRSNLRSTFLIGTQRTRAAISILVEGKSAVKILYIFYSYLHGIYVS